MLAAYCSTFDTVNPLAALTVGDVPDPIAPDGWVTVDIRAAAVNGHELWSLRGVGLGKADLPRVLGSDGAGIDEDGNEVVIFPIVSDVAPRGAQTLDAKVFPLLSERHDGTLAERVVVPRHCLVPKPKNMTFEQAAALPTAWLTAYRMIFTLSSTKPGDTVLIQGATGGVSTALIALSRAAGLTVWVTGRTERGRTRALELGADAAFETGQRLPGRVDAVFETVGEATWEHSLKSARVGATIVTAGATSGSEPPADLKRVFFNQLRIIGTRVGSLDEMSSLLDLCEDRKIEPVIDSVFTLDNTAAALEKLQTGGVEGKVIVVPR